MDSATKDQLREDYEVACRETHTKGAFGNFAQPESAEDEEREVVAINQGMQTKSILQRTAV